MPKLTGIILTKADHIQNSPDVKQWLEYRIKNLKDKNGNQYNKDYSKDSVKDKEKD